jgi:hypothetical protein
MKYYKLIFESPYIDRLKDDIINLLSMSKTHGFKKIKTSMLLRDLKNIGYNVNEQGLVSLLDEIDMVSTVDKDFIELNGSDSDSDVSDVEIPKLDRKPLDDIESDMKDDTVDRIARKRAREDLK